MECQVRIRNIKQEYKRKLQQQKIDKRLFEYKTMIQYPGKNIRKISFSYRISGKNIKMI